MKVTMTRDMVASLITVVDVHGPSSTALFPVVRIKLNYKNGSAAVIQRVDHEKWDGPVKVFWSGSQYTVDEIVEMIQQVRDAGAMDAFDKGPVTVEYHEPSLLTEPGSIETT